METRVKYETANRYEYIQLYITEYIEAMQYIKYNNIGLLLQHTLPEQNTYGNGYVYRNMLEINSHMYVGKSEIENKV